jgi:CubicO group peptidase (beta-lactamase class C family)
MSVGPLVAMLESVDEKGMDVRGLLLLKDCTLVLERYKSGVGRDHNHAVYSVTKSVVSTLVGVLRRDGKLPDLNSPVTTIAPRPVGVTDLAWERASMVSLKNVMNMASGFAYVHNPRLHPIYDQRINRFTTALSQDVAAKPGERFNYSDADASITGAVVAAVADADLYTYAKSELLNPLQMSNHEWWFRDVAGRPPGGWGFRMRPMDMLKLGQLYLQNGLWNGKRIFDSDYTSLAWTRGPSKAYGLHWWIGREVAGVKIEYYAAIGFKGQRIYVIPKLGVVAAVVASVPSAEERVLDTTVLNAIVAAAKPTHEKANTGGAELDARVRRGFRGITRSPQSAQDAPRGPR